VDADVRIGFERTIEQDIAFGVRQQIDIGCKALSPAVNDPYTAVQANDHLSVVCCDLAVRPLGTKIINGPGAGDMSSYQETTSPITSSLRSKINSLRSLAVEET